MGLIWVAHFDVPPAYLQPRQGDYNEVAVKKPPESGLGEGEGGHASGSGEVLDGHGSGSSNSSGSSGPDEVSESSDTGLASNASSRRSRRVV
jgi:hypothetical protein